MTLLCLLVYINDSVVFTYKTVLLLSYLWNQHPYNNAAKDEQIGADPVPHRLQTPPCVDLVLQNGRLYQEKSYYKVLSVPSQENITFPV